MGLRWCFVLLMCSSGKAELHRSPSTPNRDAFLSDQRLLFQAAAVFSFFSSSLSLSRIQFQFLHRFQQTDLEKTLWACRTTNHFSHLKQANASSSEMSSSKFVFMRKIQDIKVRTAPHTSTDDRTKRVFHTPVYF